MATCTPQQIIQHVPTVQTFLLPPQWVMSLPQTSSVYTSLYHWILDQEAWGEYLQKYPDRLVPHAGCDWCEQRIDVSEAILIKDTRWYVDEMISTVLCTSCFSLTSEFDNMEWIWLADVCQEDLENVIVYDRDERLETLKLWGVIPFHETGIVYFIYSKEMATIKIGFTAGDVETRIQSLQTSHPYPLTLLATMQGDRTYEKSLHERFKKFRLQGEWFVAHPDLFAFITTLNP